MQITEELVLQWIDSKKNAIKESSLLQYIRVADIILREANTIDVTDNNFGQLLYERLENKYSLRSIQNIFTIGNQILDFGYKSGSIQTPLKLSFKSKIVRKNTIQVLTEKEQRIFTGYLLDDMDSSKFGVLLCLYTGIRLGELCGLRWEDFDIQRGCFYVRRTIQRISKKGEKSYFLIDTPKTVTSAREIPFPPALKNIIVSRCKQSDKSFYIASDSENFVQPRTYQNRLKTYFRKCGIPAYHFHTLRHTFASRAVEFGFEIKALSEILGHSSVKTTLEIYTHPSLECKTKEMNRFSKLIKSVTQN